MKGILAVFWLILVPVAVGRLPFVKRRQPLLAERFVSGYLFLFSIMELLTLPMTFLKTPLHVLVISYGIIALLLAAGGIFATVKQRDKIRIKDIFGTENIYLWAVMLLILAQIAMCVFLAHMDADDAVYVAQATTDVQTDTIFEVIPYTGLKYYGLPSRYVLSPFPVFLAVVSQLSMGLHPAIMAHMIFPAVFLLAVEKNGSQMTAEVRECISFLWRASQAFQHIPYIMREVFRWYVSGRERPFWLLFFCRFCFISVRVY